MWAVFAEMFGHLESTSFFSIRAVERLEQLRLIEAGLTIATFPVAELSVDTSDQLNKS